MKKLLSEEQVSELVSGADLGLSQEDIKKLYYLDYVAESLQIHLDMEKYKLKYWWKEALKECFSYVIL